VRERHAVEGAEQPAGLAQPVEALGGLQCLLRLEGITRVDRRVAGLEGVERGLGEGDSGNLALAHRLASVDQRQTHERRGALPRRRHGVRSFVSCSAASKLDGSSSNASCPRARSNPWIAAANSRAKLWPTAFGGAIPDQNFACSSNWRSMSLLIGPSTGCTTASRSNSMNCYGGRPKSSVTKAPAGLDYISSTMPASGTFLDRFEVLNCGNRRLSDRAQIARSPLTEEVREGGS